MMKPQISEPKNIYVDYLKTMYANAFKQKSYLMDRLSTTHYKVIKELGLEGNRWKFKWFMLFKHNREKYHKLFNERLFDSNGKTIPIKFNMMGDTDETANQ